MVIAGLQEDRQGGGRSRGPARARAGRIPAQHGSVSFVNSIADALALLDEAGLDDVGIMADTYNLWHEPPEALAASRGSRHRPPRRRRARGAGTHRPRPPGRGRNALGGACRRASQRGLGRLPRRRDLLDARRLLGTPARRGRPPRVRGRSHACELRPLCVEEAACRRRRTSALALLEGDESAFEPSEDLLRFYDDLARALSRPRMGRRRGGSTTLSPPGESQPSGPIGSSA